MGRKSSILHAHWVADEEALGVLSRCQRHRLKRVMRGSLCPLQSRQVHTGQNGVRTGGLFYSH